MDSRRSIQVPRTMRFSSSYFFLLLLTAASVTEFTAACKYGMPIGDSQKWRRPSPSSSKGSSFAAVIQENNKAAARSRNHPIPDPDPDEPYSQNNNINRQQQTEVDSNLSKKSSSSSLVRQMEGDADRFDSNNDALFGDPPPDDDLDTFGPDDNILGPEGGDGGDEEEDEYYDSNEFGSSEEEVLEPIPDVGGPQQTTTTEAPTTEAEYIAPEDEEEEEPYPTIPPPPLPEASGAPEPGPPRPYVPRQWPEGGQWTREEKRIREGKGTRDVLEVAKSTKRALVAYFKTLKCHQISRVPEKVMQHVDVEVLAKELPIDYLQCLPRSLQKKIQIKAYENNILIPQLLRYLRIYKFRNELDWEDLATSFPADAYNQMDDNQLAALPWPKIMPVIPPYIVSGFSARVLASIGPEAWAATPSSTIRGINPANLAKVPVHSLRKIPSRTMKQLGCTKLSVFATDVLKAIEMYDAMLDCNRAASPGAAESGPITASSSNQPQLASASLSRLRLARRRRKLNIARRNRKRRLRRNRN